MRWLFFIVFITSHLQGKPLQISVKAEEALLMNAKTGKVLYEKNGYQVSFPASTTKIATALLALHKYREKLDAILVADRESIASISPQAKRQSNYRSPTYWLESDSTHIGIKKGETFPLYDLLNALLIPSANDAANVIAHSLGGSIPKYMDEVNAYLQGIGCKNTHFNNPHGLHHPEHFTTAYDLALMAKVALQDPIFRQIVSTVRYTCPQTNLELERTFLQTNQLLKSGSNYYGPTIGVKTGTTQDAGKNLVAAAQKEERELIAVALGYRGPWSELYQDVIKMFEAAFNEPLMRHTLFSRGEQKFVVKVSGSKTPLKTYLLEDLTHDFYSSEEEPIKVAVSWKIPSLPIPLGAFVGYVRVLNAQGNLLQERELYSLRDLNPTFLYRITHFFSENKLGRKCAFLGGSTLIVFFLWSIRRKKLRHR